MTAAPAFAAVDWGSSRVRVWLMDERGTVLAERRSDDGMLSAAGRFGAVLEAHLEALGAPANLPAFICGMAGARGGWVEAPYVEAPAPLERVFAGAVPVPGAPRRTLILPGVAQRGNGPDVMRGEETQLAGVRRLFAGETRVACLPGTHSKWVEAGEGAIQRFNTFLTGESFAVFAKHSILARTIEGATEAVEPDRPAFRAAALAVLTDGDALGRLFSVRAAGLVAGLAPPDAAARLSGLLIGAEIFAARQRFAPAGPVVLVASGRMAELYGAALALAGLAAEAVDADEAVRGGLAEATRHHAPSPASGGTAC